MHSAIVISSLLLLKSMKIKSIGSLTVAAIFAVTIGMIGLSPSAAAEEWKISNGFA